MAKDEPLIPASKSLPELTLKVFVFSIILSAFLAASNAYLALKIGTTISASIPASVLAIGILRFFKNSNVLESNIIQTAASGGEGVAAAVAFTLPAMVLLHIWTSFPYWEVVAITASGGVLGVLFSVPLRRVMLNLPALRFPEGTAIGNVLKASTQGTAQMKLLAQGGAVGALFSFAQNGLQVIGSQMNLWTRAGTAIIGMNIGFSPAPLAAGFIVGFEAGSSILIGFIGGWLLILPLIAQHMGGMHGTGSIYDYAMKLWSAKLRYVGVGVMLVGGVWTLVRLLKPVIDGMKVSFSSVSKMNKGKSRTLRTEHDMSIKLVLIGTVVIAVLFFFLVMHFLNAQHLMLAHSHLLAIAMVTVIYLVLIGFVLATICGYFTGLIGSTNNPLSGILIIALLVIGAIFMIMVPHSNTTGEGKIAGLMILITTIVATIASISNENLQDLKAGHMVGATPWKQQFILIVGVITSALVIGPVFEMLFQAYGIGGVFPHPGMDPSHMLAAPQAGLMAAVAKGLRSHQLPWHMIELGGIFAVVCIFADEYLKRFHNKRVAVLAVGLGVYLPPEITTPVIIGSLINLFVRMAIAKVKDNKEKVAEKLDKQQSATMLACGLVAGAAIMGVLLAVPFMLLGSADALAIVPASFLPIANVIGLVGLMALVYWIWRTASK
ncbi:MAG: oligopeptide transporter, OPT family [Coxiella sp. (in: Bacteria)]|nr:MAG: oligopeptide transporter, OPT family [Coxiella sp. (in: g-proteobacteria)]